MPAKSKAHYAGDYQRRARAVRAAANANPSTRCWRCGRTLDQHPNTSTGKRPHWTAGHTVDADNRYPLAAEANTCNSSAGATYGNNGRVENERHSERWTA